MIKLIPQTLTARLLATTALVLITTVTIITFLVLSLLRLEPEIIVGHELRLNAERVQDGLRFHADGSVDDAALSELMRTAYRSLKDDYAFRLLDQNGATVLSSDEQTAPLVEREGAPPKLGNARFDLDRDGLIEHVLTQEISHDGRTYYLQVMRSDRLIQAMLGSGAENMRPITLAAVLVTMLVFSIAAAATIKRLLQPLRLVSEAAAKISPLNLSERVSTTGFPAELLPLVHAFNDALGRVEKGYRIQREFLATAAHELKTPIALMRAEIELDGVGDKALLLRDLDQMARQVHQLLHLAEVSELQNYKFQRIDAVPLTGEIIDGLRRLALRNQLQLELQELGTPVFLYCDAGAFCALVRNLVENAIHHAPANSVVTIQLDACGLSVRDRGAGVAADMQQRLFNRFARGAHRRDTGAGLGLSICEEVTTIHGWKIGFSNCDPGARFSVTF